MVMSMANSAGGNVCRFNSRVNFGQGQTVTIMGYRAKDSSNFAFMRKMTFADGHSVELWLGDDEAGK